MKLGLQQHRGRAVGMPNTRTGNFLEAIGQASGLDASSFEGLRDFCAALLVKEASQDAQRMARSGENRARKVAVAVFGPGARRPSVRRLATVGG